MSYVFVPSWLIGLAIFSLIVMIVSLFASEGIIGRSCTKCYRRGWCKNYEEYGRKMCPKRTFKNCHVKKCWIIASISLVIFILTSSSCTRIVGDTVKTRDETHQDITLNREICALANGFSINGEGHWAFGGGSMVVSSGDTYRYYYYKKGDNGGYRQGNVPVENTLIRYIDPEKETPKVVGYYEYPIEYWEYQGEERQEAYEFKAQTYYVLYIPEGSIAELYTLN